MWTEVKSQVRQWRTGCLNACSDVRSAVYPVLPWTSSSSNHEMASSRFLSVRRLVLTGSSCNLNEDRIAYPAVVESSII